MNRPFLPNERNANTFTQSVIRAVAAFGRGETPADPQAAAVLKTAMTPTALTTTGVPTATALATFMPMLSPASAIRNVISLSPHADIAQYGAMAVVNLKASGSGMGPVAEGAPIPMFQFTLSDSDLTPKKFAFCAAFSRPVWEHTNAEAYMTPVLQTNATLAAESLLSGATAGSASAPAGLKYNNGAVTADAGSGEAAMLNDLANIAANPASVGGANICFIASPKQYIKIMLKKPADFPPVFMSSALADRQVACLAIPALVFAGYGVPQIKISKQAVVVMQDSSPQHISAVGTPNTVAAPTFNTFQQDGVALKVVMDLDWVLRNAAGFAWTQSVNW